MMIPDWLADKELPHWPGAYESVEPSLRALLKAQIAMLHEAWLPQTHEGGVTARLSDGGDRFASALSPDWAILAFDAAYASPAGCIAATLPVLMAGAETVLIVRLDGAKEPLPPAISVALEFLGREEAFALSNGDFLRLASQFREQSANGVLLALGHELDGAYPVPAQVRIGLEPGAEPDGAILSWLHPAVKIEAVRAGVAYDAVITPSPDFYRLYPAPLVLGPEYAYFWQWPDLTPEFFRRKRLLLTRNAG